jgi:hemerythrin superfamily protein
MTGQSTMADRDTGEPISLGAALMAGKKVQPDVTSLLMEDHRTVLGWFDWFATETDRAERSRILANILKALTAHMAAEEEVFYPEATRCIGNAGLIDHARAEHQHAKEIMARLQTELADPTESLVSQLHAEIAAHVQEEETRIFPAVRNSDMELYGTGALLAAHRVETLFELARR